MNQFLGYGHMETEKEILSAGPAKPHLPPITLDKLDLPGLGKAGPGPPSPRGPGPGPAGAGLGQPSPRNSVVVGPQAPAGPSSPRGAPPPLQQDWGAPGPLQKEWGAAPPLQQEMPKMNHTGGNHGTVINKPSVPNPSLDIRNQQQQFPPAPSPAAPIQNSMTLRAPPTRAPPSKALSPPAPEPIRQNNMTNKSDISPRVSVVGAGPQFLPPTPRLEPEVPSFPDPAVLRQPNTLQISEQVSRGRTPTRQERARAAAGGANHNEVIAGSQAGGGYNFQKIMDDRFEHYKRPPSRERSSDRYGLGSRQGSRQQLSRDTSRDRVNTRPMSRQRTPQEMNFSESKPSASLGLDSLNLDSAAGGANGNGSAVGAGLADLRLPATDDQLRFRGVHQEIPHFGAPPKRTESLYMKPGENQQPTYKVNAKYPFSSKNRFAIC